jgi:carboxyl-terminal processing protease
MSRRTRGFIMERWQVVRQSSMRASPQGPLGIDVVPSDVKQTRPAQAFFGTALVCLLIAVASYWGTRWVLGKLEPATGDQPLEFNPAVLAEANPYLADLMAATQAVGERWSYAEHRREISDLDLVAHEAAAFELLGVEPDAASFHRALNFYIAGLKDGHAFVHIPDSSRPGEYRWPFNLLEVAEGIMVHGVLKTLTSPVNGDLLLAVDDRPVNDLIAQAELEVFASTDGARRRQAIRYLPKRDMLAERRFRFLGADGVEFEWTLNLPPYYKTLPTPALLPSDRSHRILEDRVAYFRPGNFSPPPDSGWPGPPEGRNAILAQSYAEFDQIFGSFADSRALILDLRGNPGGTDLLGQFLIDRLVEPGYVYSQLSQGQRESWLGFGKHGSSAEPGKNNFRGPLICLIDEATFSTADNVVACLADVHPDVRFVGRPNGAGTGAPRSFELPRTGAKITFCTMRVRTPSGRMGEGISVKLDAPVTWTRDDVLQGRDPDLAKAMQLLQR